MRQALWVWFAFAGTAACSYIFELPATTTSPTDPDASTDASALEDAPPPYDAPPVVPFCASQSGPFLYCNDFDATPVPELASIGTVELTGGQLVLSNAVAHSPPRSLLASVRGTASTAGVTHALGTAPDGLTFSFDLLVSEWNTTDGQLSKIELSDGTTECAVRLDGNATTWALTQVCTSGGTETARSTTDSEIAIVRGRWQTFALRISFADPPSVKLDIDSTRVVDDLAVAPLTRAQTSIVLGTTLVPSGSVTIFQDNVLVTSP